MSQLAHDLTLYSGNTPLNASLQVTPSAAKRFFESDSFKAFKQSKDDEVKRQVGISERLNSVIAGLNNVAKAASKR